MKLRHRMKENSYHLLSPYSLGTLLVFFYTFLFIPNNNPMRGNIPISLYEGKVGGRINDVTMTGSWDLN